MPQLQLLITTLVTQLCLAALCADAIAFEENSAQLLGSAGLSACNTAVWVGFTVRAAADLGLCAPAPSPRLHAHRSVLA